MPLVASTSSSNRAPNPRLQRTRSAPLRSPLSRKPFGDGSGRVAFGPSLSTAAFILTLVACGRIVPPVPSTITVIAADAQGMVIPGIAVKLDAVGEPGHFEATTDAKGSATFAGLRAGEFQASGPSFGTEPTHAVRVKVAEGQSVTVRFLIRTQITDSVKVK